MDSKSLESETAKEIALYLIYMYGISLLLTGLGAFFKGSNLNNAWLELFKSGFLILGGGLTTIIGYYFGSRGAQEAQKMAEAARLGFEESEAELDIAKEELAPTSDEGSLELPQR